MSIRKSVLYLMCLMPILVNPTLWTNENEYRAHGFSNSLVVANKASMLVVKSSDLMGRPFREYKSCTGQPRERKHYWNEEWIRILYEQDYGAK